MNVEILLNNGTVSDTGTSEESGVSSRLDCVRSTGIGTVLKLERREEGGIDHTINLA